MAKAQVDPAELRRFATDLNRFNNDLQSLVQGLNGRLRGLEATWRDQEQRKFTEAFDSTVKSLAGFLEQSHQHVSFLAKKATLVEEYLKRTTTPERYTFLQLPFEQLHARHGAITGIVAPVPKLVPMV